MDLCANPECKSEFSPLNRPHTCVYCGKEYCAKCVIKKGKFRQVDYFCNGCFSTIENKIFGLPTARNREIKEQLSVVRDAKLKAGRDTVKIFKKCESCGKKFTEKEQFKLCIFCMKAFCPECLVHEGEFRVSDHFCGDCAGILMNSVMLSSETAIPGYAIAQVIRPISSLKYRSQDITEFFLKWQARSLGANAVIAYKTAPSLDKTKVIGAGTAVMLKRIAEPVPAPQETQTIEPAAAKRGVSEDSTIILPSRASAPGGKTADQAEKAAKKKPAERKTRATLKTKAEDEKPEPKPAARKTAPRKPAKKNPPDGKSKK
jgi:hypothetical protein